MTVPCKYGHTSGRYKNGRCSTCAKEQKAKAWAANGDEMRAYYRNYYADNRDTLAENARRYRDDNRSSENSRRRRWGVENPTAAKAVGSRRRKFERGVERTLTAADIAAVTEAQGDRCAYCRQKVRLTLDHIIPVSKGGAHARRNVQMLCKPCNSRKSNTDPVVFANKIGLLL